jgi:hypothetical protein
MTDLASNIALYRIEINGKQWNSFTDKDEAERQLDALREHGFAAVLVIEYRQVA